MQHPNHPDHDLTLIAAHAAGDLSDTERTRAQALIDSCGECADVHRDLIAIAAATRVLPTLATAPRDFRLSPEQAARLVRRGWLRTILAPFGTAQSAVRPMAATLTSLGIAGLLVATILPGLMGGASSAAAPSAAERDQAGMQAAPTSAPAPAAAPGATQAALRPASGGSQSGPVATSNTDSAYGANGGKSAPSAPEVAGALGSATEAPRSAADLGGRLTQSPSAPNLLLIGSLALIAAGLLLFGLRFASRRLR